MKFKVIEIMNEKELIINYGSNDGANIGDDIRIYSVGEEILDPDTKVSLGTLDIIKDELEIVTVYEKFSICKKLLRTNLGSILNPLVNRTTVESVELNVDKSDVSGRKSYNNPSPIKVGDSVIILK